MRGEGVGGGGGQAVNVHILVNRLEKSEVSRKFSKFVKPRGRRGVKKDTLIQAQTSSILTPGG